MKKAVFLRSLVFSLLLSGGLTLLADVAAALCSFQHGISDLFLAFCCFSVLLCWLCVRNGRAFLKGCSVAAAVFIFLAGGMILCRSFFYNNSRYENADHGKERVFAGKKVMVFAPHEDDELNLFCGLFEQYMEYGSEIKVVFFTNGDRNMDGSIRITEALAAMDFLGLPEENVIFLGYGDGYYYKHLYNASAGERLISVAGYMETRGIASHPSYVEEHEFTIENCLADIKNCILEFSPDIIFCSDLDGHPEHRADSLLFERAIGELLRENEDYNPEIMKGFAYSTGYYAPDDFYALNILSTQNPGGSDTISENGILRWSERVRLPVSASALSRSLYNTSGYLAAQSHASQNAQSHAASFVNGDRVFWHRSTASHCYGADISGSTGNASVLNDFLVYDSVDIDNWDTPLDAGVWIPDSDDADKTVTVSFPKAQPVSVIRLYDNPSLQDNVISCILCLDSGEEYTVLPDNMLPVDIDLGGVKKINSFTVRITESEGEKAGFCEIEAYESLPFKSAEYIKLEDTQGNFIYDCVVPLNGKMELCLYSCGTDTVLSECSVVSQNSSITAETDGTGIFVKCPRGERGVITVVSADSLHSDSVFVSNPGLAYRAGFLAEKLWHELTTSAYKETAVYSLLHPLYERITAE